MEDLVNMSYCLIDLTYLCLGQRCFVAELVFWKEEELNLEDYLHKLHYRRNRTEQNIASVQVTHAISFLLLTNEHVDLSRGSICYT